MQKFNGSLIRQFPSLTTGNAASGVQVSVFAIGTNTLATLYATNNVAGAQLSNPLTTDGKGFYAFFAADGRYRLEFNNGFPALEVQLVDVIDINNEVTAAIADVDAALTGLDNTVSSLTLTVAFDFNTGGTVTARNQVVLWSTASGGDGREYRWAGALPKTVPPASTPASTGGISDSAWVYTADVALEQKLIAGDVSIKNPSGTAALPSITFGTDTDTGLFRKVANSLGLSTGGVERVTVTSAGRVGVAKESPAAKLHVEVQNDVTAGIRSTCFWEGSTATPFQNNDCTLFEVRNKTLSDSTNFSWSVSADNGENDIPAGIVDSGFRKGVYGWAVSKHNASYQHHGTLNLQIGVHGLAGFLGVGNAATGTVNEAIGVRGEINHDAASATIGAATAGEFISVSTTGVVNDNYAVRAVALNGVNFNYSFHGDAGEFFNQDKALFGSKFTELSSKVSARGVGNSYEFGFPSAGGYESAVGVMPSSGAPFISFCASVDAVTDTFTTTGQPGFVVYNQLSSDSFIFASIPLASASAQSPVEAFRVDNNNRVQFAGTPIIPAFAPASASAAGQTGQIAWDSDYIYICVGTNAWKRVAIATW